MEENVNFDNEVLAYLTIRKVTTVGMALSRPIGSIDWESQDLHSGTPRDQRGPQRLPLKRAPSQTSKWGIKLKPVWL